MKNYKILILISILIFPIGKLFSQTEIYFNYDEAGNQEMRYPIFGLVQNDDEVIQASTNDAHSLSETSQDSEQIIVLDDGEIQLSFYPNPVKDDLVIDVFNTTGIEQKVSLEIYDTAGKVVLSRTIGDNSSQLNVSTFSPGNYIVKATLNNEVVEWQFIKQ